MDEVACPYCDSLVKITTGEDWEDAGDCYEKECPHCEKMFVFSAEMVVSLDARQAPCLNGGEHDLYKRRGHYLKWDDDNLTNLTCKTVYKDVLKCRNCDYQEDAK